jgi:hypothetical protein
MQPPRNHYELVFVCKKYIFKEGQYHHAMGNSIFLVNIKEIIKLINTDVEI